MTYSIGSITWADSEVQDENFEIKGFLTPNPLFGKGSDETIVNDDGGVVFTVLLKIKKVDSLANLATHINDLQGLINGKQYIFNGYPLTYTSDLVGTIKVKVQNIDGFMTRGRPRVLEYTIQLVEASTRI